MTKKQSLHNNANTMSITLTGGILSISMTKKQSLHNNANIMTITLTGVYTILSISMTKKQSLNNNANTMKIPLTGVYWLFRWRKYRHCLLPVCHVLLERHEFCQSPDQLFTVSPPLFSRSRPSCLPPCTCKTHPLLSYFPSKSTYTSSLPPFIPWWSIRNWPLHTEIRNCWSVLIYLDL